MKLTVKEYATRLQLTTQYVYKQVATNKIKSIKENGRRYIITNDKDIANKLQTNYNDDITSVATNSYQNIIDYLQKELKNALKENKRLTKKLEKCNGTKEKVLLQYISELNQVRITQKPEELIEEDFIEVKKKKEKKKGKKKKR